MDIAKLRTDPEKADGVWCDIADGFKVRVRRASNPEYLAAVRRLGKDEAFKIRAGFGDDERLLRVTNRALAETVLVGWEGMDEDGKKVEFSIINAERILNEYPELRDWIVAISDDAERFRQERLADELGNSPTSPSGTPLGQEASTTSEA